MIDALVTLLVHLSLVFGVPPPYIGSLNVPNSQQEPTLLQQHATHVERSDISTASQSAYPLLNLVGRAALLVDLRVIHRSSVDECLRPSWFLLGSTLEMRTTRSPWNVTSAVRWVMRPSNVTDFHRYTKTCIEISVSRTVADTTTAIRQNEVNTGDFNKVAADSKDSNYHQRL